MPEEFNIETLTKAWKDFLKDYHEKDLLELANSYPDKRSLLVSYNDIEVFDSALAAYLIDHPNNAIYAAEAAMRESFPSEVKISAHFRVKDLPSLPPKPLAAVEVRDLRARHIGRFVAVKGLVRKATQVKPKIVDAVFQCARCGAVIREPQTEQIYKEPLECYKDQGGCGKGAASTRFTLLTGDTLQAPGRSAARSEFVDTQKIEIQESPENLRGGDQPERLSAFAEDDLCKKITPGDDVVLNGILRSHQKATGGVKTTLFDWTLEVNSIERKEKEFEELEITPEEEKDILKMAKDKDLYRNIVKSIAPTIYGMDLEKEALALQMFGGVRKDLPDGTKLRGDIHCLLVGDPGCLVGDERVVLGNGGIIKMADLGTRHLEPIHTQVLTGQGYTRDVATRFHSYANQPILELVTESGKCIKGTPNHPLLAVEGPYRHWKRLDCFRPGDRVATVWRIQCPLTSPVPTGWTHRAYTKGPHAKCRLPKLLDRDTAALLGYLLGDGWVREDRIGYDVNHDEQDLLPKLGALVWTVFGIKARARVVNPRTTAMGDRIIVRRHPLTMVEASSKDVAEALGFLKVKRVPDLILRSPNRVVAEFLAWLFEADGCAFSKGRGKRAVQLKSRKIELLRDVQMLLLRFGIHSRILGDNLAIRRARALARFSKEIGFRSEKKKGRLDRLVRDCRKLKQHLWGRQLSERVVSVRPAGTADVFDIEVPRSHRFIANGIISHNTAKSQLLRYCSGMVPRGIYASGKATTAAGLTAAAVHDESGFGEGRWTLEAGALVLADKGLACVDELDKMSEQDSSSMHEAMEQQRISVAKAGITATLQSRCAILAAANPKEGRFDEHGYIAEQIDLSPALLSRFDVIFPLTDKPERKKDEALANHIVQVHMAGEMAQYRKNVPDRRFTKEDEEKAMERVEPIYPREKMKKYIAYARSHVFPVMTPETAEIIEEYYVTIRAQSKSVEEGGGAVPMTPRQIEAMIRLSEASARMRLSKEVTPDDAERAKKVIEYFLRRVATEGGVVDIDNIMTGISQKRKDRFQVIVDIVEENDDGRGVTEETILQSACKDGTPEEKVRKDIQRLLNDGRLWNPSGDRYKVMRREPR